MLLTKSSRPVSLYKPCPFLEQSFERRRQEDRDFSRVCNPLLQPITHSVIKPHRHLFDWWHLSLLLRQRAICFWYSRCRALPLSKSRSGLRQLAYGRCSTAFTARMTITHECWSSFAQFTPSVITLTYRRSLKPIFNYNSPNSIFSECATRIRHYAVCNCHSNACCSSPGRRKAALHETEGQPLSAFSACVFCVRRTIRDICIIRFGRGPLPKMHPQRNASLF